MYGSPEPHVAATQATEDRNAAATERRSAWIEERARFLRARLLCGITAVDVNGESLGESFAEWLIAESDDPDSAIAQMVRVCGGREPLHNLRELYSTYAEQQATFEARPRDWFDGEDTDA